MVKMVLMAPLVLLVVLLVELVAKEVPVVLPVTLDLVAVAAQGELALEELGVMGLVAVVPVALVMMALEVRTVISVKAVLVAQPEKEQVA